MDVDVDLELDLGVYLCMDLCFIRIDIFGYIRTRFDFPGKRLHVGAAPHVARSEHGTGIAADGLREKRRKIERTFSL